MSLGGGCACRLLRRGTTSFFSLLLPIYYGQATAVDGSVLLLYGRGTDVRGVAVCIGGACQLY